MQNNLFFIINYKIIITKIIKTKFIQKNTLIKFLKINLMNHNFTKNFNYQIMIKNNNTK